MSHIIEKKFFKRLLWEESRQCAYCGVWLSFKTATIDHVIPSEKGGKTEIDNLVLTCLACNGAKANMTLEEFGEWRLHQNQIRKQKKYLKKTLKEETSYPVVKNIQKDTGNNIEDPVIAMMEQSLSNNRQG